MEHTPVVIFVSGLPGSGKTHFAKRFAHATGAQYIGTDIVRKEMLAKRIYSLEERGSVYDQILERMQKLLSQGKDVLVDATFCNAGWRARFTEVALANGARHFWLRMVAEEAIIKARLSRPREDSDADYSVFLKLQEECDQFMGEYLELDSSADDYESLEERAKEYIHAKP